MIAPRGTGFYNPYQECRERHSPIPHAIGYNNLPASKYRVRKQRSQARPTVVLEWVAEGALELHLADHTLQVPSGASLLTLQPLDARYGGATQGETNRIQTLWFSVEDPLLGEYLAKRLPLRFAVIPESNGFTPEDIQSLFNDLHASASASYEKLALRCHAFWREVAAWADSRRMQVRTGPPFNENILKEFHDRIGEKRLIQKVARHSGLSREHFGRVFKQHVGLTPRDYVAKSRLRRLEELLRTTSLSASAASESAGFPSYLLAARCFKRAHGVSMGPWRKKEEG